MLKESHQGTLYDHITNLDIRQQIPLVSSICTSS